ncbi:MAG: DUF2635 domain-containing protein [Pseudomonadota bacterium]
MSQQIYVVPQVDPQTKQPYQVRLPNKPQKFLSPEGAFVERSVFWVRRLRDGTVSEVTPPKKAKAKE